MRRFFLILITLLTALGLMFSTSCKKDYLKDHPEEDEPTPGPSGPPGPAR